MVDDLLAALDVGMVEQRPAEELERLAPGVDELGQAVAVGVLDFPVGEVVAVEDRAQRPAALDQEGVEHLGPGGGVLVVVEVGLDLGDDVRVAVSSAVPTPSAHSSIKPLPLLSTPS